MMAYLGLMALCLSQLGCSRAPEAKSDESPATMKFESIQGLLIARSADPSKLTVTRTGDAIRGRRFDSARPLRFMTFQARGEKKNYGVYGLGQAKDDMIVPPPLDGKPIRWEDIEHEQALRRLLGMEGLSAPQVDAALAAKGEEWFGEGLRAFCVLSRDLAVELLAPEVIPEGRTLIIVFELDG